MRQVEAPGALELAAWAESCLLLGFVALNKLFALLSLVRHLWNRENDHTSSAGRPREQLCRGAEWRVSTQCLET